MLNTIVWPETQPLAKLKHTVQLWPHRVAANIRLIYTAACPASRHDFLAGHVPAPALFVCQAACLKKQLNVALQPFEWESQPTKDREQNLPNARRSKITSTAAERNMSGAGTFRHRSIMFPSVRAVVWKGKYELFGSITSAADRKCFA